MHTATYILGWAFLCAALLVSLARYYNPATFSQEALYTLIASACILRALSIARKTYE